MKEETEMIHIPCPKCKSKAEEIILASENKRVGWWCRTCNHFQKAILREKKSGMNLLFDAITLPEAKICICDVFIDITEKWWAISIQ